MTERTPCESCRLPATAPLDFTFAFQPIVNALTRSVFSYEALVRGPAGESAASVLALVNDDNQYRFDQECRVRALTLAARLGVDVRLNINFLPNAIYEPERCIRTTLAAATKLAFPTSRIVFEVTEGQSMADHRKLVDVFREYRRLGFTTAIDDFGAGYAGLGLLANFQPDIVKIDMALIRDVDHDPTKQAIVRSIVGLCSDLGITLIAEGVETSGEYVWLRRAGVDLIQGYLFAKPGFEELPAIAWQPDVTRV